MWLLGVDERHGPARVVGSRWLVVGLELPPNEVVLELSALPGSLPFAAGFRVWHTQPWQRIPHIRSFRRTLSGAVALVGRTPGEGFEPPIP